MTKRNRTKGQTTIYNTLHRKLRGPGWLSELGSWIT